MPRRLVDFPTRTPRRPQPPRLPVGDWLECRHRARGVAAGGGRSAALGALERCVGDRIFCPAPDEVDLYSLSLPRASKSTRALALSSLGTPLVSLLRVFSANGTPLALDNQQGGDPPLDLPGGDGRHLLCRRQQRAQQ